jgi:hypothetical protein
MPIQRSKMFDAAKFTGYVNRLVKRKTVGFVHELGAGKNWSHKNVRPHLEGIIRRKLFGGFQLNPEALETIVKVGNINALIAEIMAVERIPVSDVERAKAQAIEILEEIEKRHDDFSVLVKKILALPISKEERLVATDVIGHLATPGGFASIMLTELKKQK